MSSIQHYRDAEYHLDYARSQTEIGSTTERYHLAAAQVHATLAQAAVFAAVLHGDMKPQDAAAWAEALGHEQRQVGVDAEYQADLDHRLPEHTPIPKASEASSVGR